ncbi:MAG: iron-sulfur cluster assembly scaffold protein [Verrucomicrobiota bacterium]
MDEFEAKVQDAITNPLNQGEMSDADAVGTVGSPECGDMLRMWLKFSEKDGRKVIDRASFQSFGCQTAIAVASMATEMLKGKTVEEASTMEAEELSKDLGPLPPMKMHCGQMVEGALREALDAEGSSKEKSPEGGEKDSAPTLLDQLQGGATGSKKIKVVPLSDD